MTEEENWMSAPLELRPTKEPLDFPRVDVSQPYERLTLHVEDVGPILCLLHQPGRLTWHRADDSTIEDEAKAQYWRMGFVGGLNTAIENGESLDEIWDQHVNCWAAGNLEQVEPG